MSERFFVERHDAEGFFVVEASPPAHEPRVIAFCELKADAVMICEFMNGNFVAAMQMRRTAINASDSDPSDETDSPF